jgi:ABC-type transport system substrate-binding protein/class 3 adenylate cyclase/streptogramin lyase
MAPGPADDRAEGLIEGILQRAEPGAADAGPGSELVAVLIADIRGYTTFTQTRGDEAAAKLTSKFEAIVRSLVPEFGGTVVEIRGDEALCAFSSPRQCLRLAVTLQQRFVEETLADAELPMPVGIGIDVGEAVRVGDGYRGGALNLAARLCGVAKAGQILATPEATHLARAIDGIRYADVDRVALKGLSVPVRPVRVYPEAEDPAQQMPALVAAAGPTPPSRRRRRPRRSAVVLAAAVVGAVVAGTLIGVAVSGGSGGHTAVQVTANSAVELDGSGSVLATVPVGDRPVAIVSAAGSLWVADYGDLSVARLDPKQHKVIARIAMDAAPTALVAAGGEVWVSDSDGGISRIDPHYDVATPVTHVAIFAPGLAGWPMLAAFGSVWVVVPDGFVIRFDAQSARREGEVVVGNDPSAIAAGAGSVWVANRADGTVTRIDPSTLLTTAIPVGHGPTAIAVDSSGAWVANGGTDEIVRIDTATNATSSPRSIGKGPVALIATRDALWVSNGAAGTVQLLDPRSGKVRNTIRLGGTPQGLTSDGTAVWATIAPAPPPAGATGGVLHLTAQNTLGSLDPAFSSANAPQLSYALCANLVTYPDKPAPEGSQIVPEVAEAVPAPSDGGRTYTFTIRPGFRFSAPSNAPVTAQTFKSTIERVVDPRLKSPLAGLLSGIVGYQAFVSGRAHALSGLVVHGDTLTVHLARPDGAFLANLASGAACAAPTGAPVVARGLPDVPSAGPYYVSSNASGQQVVLRRNPNYRGERPHRFDQIVVTIGVDSSKALTQIEAGSADYAYDGLPRDAAGELEATYGPGSPAAKDGHQQYFINPANGVRWLHMNTSRPLFADVRLRRAVNYAIDRPALAAQGRRVAEINPFNAGAPSDDLMPPSVTGAPDLHVYPVSGPDLARAKQLAGHIHATAVMYTANVAPWLNEAQIIKTDLRPIGIDVQIHAFPVSVFFDRITRRDAPFDLASVGWGGGDTDPHDLLSIFDGTTIRAANNSNLSYFDNPRFDRQLHAAYELSGPRRYRTFANLELELERDYAPAAPFAVDASRDFFSARIGCQLYQPVWGIDLGALCVRT